MSWNVQTFLNMQQATIRQRFKAAQRDDVKDWINTRMLRLWTAARWSFTESDPLALALTLHQNYVAFPSTLRTVENVWDDTGDELEKLPFHELQQQYRSGWINGTYSRPEAFAVRGRKIYLGTSPDSAYTFSCDGQLVFGHADSTGAFVTGPMTADSDEPYWPDHREILVVGAKALGSRIEADPTADALEEEFESLFAAMVDELAVDHGVTSYGTIDPL